MFSGVASPGVSGKEQKRLGGDLPSPSMSSKQTSSYTVDKAGIEIFALHKQQLQRGFDDIYRDSAISGAIKMFNSFVAGYFALFFDIILD